MRPNSSTDFSLGLVCLVLIASGCTRLAGNPNRTFSSTKSTDTMEIKIPQVCVRCGNLPSICAFKSDTDPQDIVLFCEVCALQGVRELPPCTHLVIAAVSPPSGEAGPQIRNEYQVLSLDQLLNDAKIKIIREGKQASVDPTLVVRYDAIPTNAREVGSTFTIRGTAQEIALFEQSSAGSLGEANR